MNAYSDLGNLLMVVLNTPGWFGLKFVVVLPRVPVKIWGDRVLEGTCCAETPKHLRECGSGCTGDPMSPTP